MDGYQQPPRFMRPSPPPVPLSTSDPHHLYQHQQPPPRPPQAPWFFNQFQYQPTQSPSPPPPPPLQWGGPPPPPHSSDHFNPSSSGYPPPPQPYPPHPHHNQFPPPPLPPPPPPPPHPHSQVPQPYSQEWGNPNWVHRQGWDYAGAVHSNEEDWGAKAKAWSAAKTAMENQHPESHFTPTGRPEDQSLYRDQYTQSIDSHHQDHLQHSFSAYGYQQFPVSATPPHRPLVGHLQEAASSSSGPSSYFPGGHLSYNVRNGTLAGESTVVPYQESLSSSPSVHQQEVPSSYSSVTGKEDAANQNVLLYKSLHLPVSSTQEGHHHVQPTAPAVGRSMVVEQAFPYSNQSADLSDQPLDFAPRFNHEHDPHWQPSYVHPDSVGPSRGVDPVAAVSSLHTWTPPVTPGAVYSSIPPVLSSGPQHDLAVAPVPGHSAPSLGRFPGPSFQSTIAGAPFGLTAGNAIHSAAAFPGDAYGISGASERPKKASVPNWLREEIIKNKASITSSSQERTKEESQAIEDEGIEKSLGKGYQADSKSIDSSRSTEEEDDDEDYVEAAKTAAINQEIKRILTEVLLKVTDELFDEIANKVLSEDDLMGDAEHNIIALNPGVSTSPPTVATSKASATVLIPVKSKEILTGSIGEKSSSSSRVDLLGLGNYASDDEDDEVQSSGNPYSIKKAMHLQSNLKKLSEDRNGNENGTSEIEHEEHDRGQMNMDSVLSKTNQNRSKYNVVTSELSHEKMVKELDHNTHELTHSSKAASRDTDLEEYVDGGKPVVNKAPLSNHTVEENVTIDSEHPVEKASVKKAILDDSQGGETRKTSDKGDRHESKKTSSGRNSVKETERGKLRSDEKKEENSRRRDERHVRKEKTDDRNGTKERMMKQDVKHGENAKESDLRKRSSRLDLEDRKESEKKLNKAGAGEDTDRKGRRAKEEEDRSRHKSGRHKRRRSSSVSSRGRNNKENLVSHAEHSSDEASDDSKRNLHSRKRNSSPSPIRNSRRRVSRSPHSKRSQRRHSPYSSLETTRERRSRSKSPVRRHR